MFSRIITSFLTILLLNVASAAWAQTLPSVVRPVATTTAVAVPASTPTATVIPAPTAIIAEPVNVLVLPFQQLGNDNNSWIGMALQQNFATEAARNPALRALAIFNMTPTIDVDVATKAAKNANAPIVIFGSYEVIDTDVRVMGYLMDVPSGHIFSAIKTTGPIRTLFVMEDRLDDQMNQALERQVPAAAAAKELELQRTAVMTPPSSSYSAPGAAPIAAQMAAPIAASPINTLPPLIYSTPEANSNSIYYPQYPAVQPYTSSIYSTPTYSPDTYYPDDSLYGSYPYVYPAFPLVGFGFGFNGGFAHRGFGGGHTGVGGGFGGMHGGHR